MVKKSTKDKKDKSLKIPTLMIAKERDVAMDFAMKVYQKFDKIIKSIILFGSSARRVALASSDIDIVILIDDVSIRWDQELIMRYREELSKLVSQNPYKKELHINTVKLSTWWEDLNRGDPVLMNILRYGETLIDFGGFFTPLKLLLEQGKIKPTPESIYTLLQRAPTHIYRMRANMLAAMDGIYWACIDSAHAALIAYDEMPASPEHVGDALIKTFVNNKKLKSKFVDFYEEVHTVAKNIVHGQIKHIKGEKLDEYSEKADNFILEMSRLINELIK
jgi:predicted nucleotidyltransferase/uncharacterized protein (UPF0332 family)